MVYTTVRLLHIFTLKMQSSIAPVTLVSQDFFFYISEHSFSITFVDSSSLCHSSIHHLQLVSHSILLWAQFSSYPPNSP